MSINLKRSLYVGLAALMVASAGISSINSVNANASRRHTRSSRVTHVRRHRGRRSRRHARRHSSRRSHRSSKRTRRSRKSKRSALLGQMKKRASASRNNADLVISNYMPGLSKSKNNKIQKYLKAHPKATLLDAVNKVTPLKQRNTKSKRSALAKKTNNARELANIGVDLKLINNSALKNTNRNRNKVLHYMQRHHINNTEKGVTTVFANTLSNINPKKSKKRNKRSTRSALKNRINRNAKQLNSVKRSKKNLGKLIALGGFKGINKRTQKKLASYLMVHQWTLNKLSNRKASKSSVRSALNNVNKRVGYRAKKSMSNAVNNLRAMNNPQASKYAEQVENGLNTTMSVKPKQNNNGQPNASDAVNDPIIAFSNGDGTISYD